MSAKKRKKTSLFNYIVLIIILGFGFVKYINSELNLFSENIKIEEKNDNIKPDSYEIPIFNNKTGGQIIVHTGYTLSYNADYKTPQWVGWHLTDKKTKGKHGRTDKFVPDPEIIGAKAYTSDYSRTGYDRGHMAPAADMKWNKKAMEESFYLSNICPQNPNLNRGDWNDLEELTRKWANTYKDVYITCGPIYDSKFPKRIGNNKVAIPDAFYKVIFINDSKNPKTIGFIFNNKSGSRPIIEYVVTVDSIEKRTGIDFFPALPDNIENKLEAEIHTTLP